MPGILAFTMYSFQKKKTTCFYLYPDTIRIQRVFRCTQRPEEGSRSSGARVPGSCEQAARLAPAPGSELTSSRRAPKGSKCSWSLSRLATPATYACVVNTGITREMFLYYERLLLHPPHALAVCISCLRGPLEISEDKHCQASLPTLFCPTCSLYSCLSL